MTRLTRRACFILVASSLLFLPRCAGLFNQTRLDKAKEAQTAFTAAKLAESLDEERKQSQAMHARELAVTAQHFAAIRDKHLLFVTAKSPRLGHAALKDRINERLGELGGGGARLVAATAKQLATFESDYDDLADTYRLARDPASDPDARCTTDAFTFSNAKADLHWKSLQKACANVAKTTKALDEIDVKGQFNDLRDQMTAIENERKRVKKEIADADKTFKDAMKTLKAQRDAGQQVDFLVPVEELKKQLDAISIDDTIKIDGIDSLLAEADIEWLEMLQTHVRNLLTAAAKDDAVEVPPGVEGDLQITKALPGIAAQLSAGLKYPRVSALVLQSEHLRLELERARAESARADEHIAILRAKREFMIKEAKYLGYALADLQTCVPDEKASAVKDITPPDCRNRYVSALISYANAWTLGRIPNEKLEWALIQLQHERSFDQSALALAQWQNLINVPLTALVKSYETGLKAEEIGRTLNAAGLGWIGLGVH